MGANKSNSSSLDKTKKSGKNSITTTKKGKRSNKGSVVDTAPNYSIYRDMICEYQKLPDRFASPHMLRSLEHVDIHDYEFQCACYRSKSVTPVQRLVLDTWYAIIKQVFPSLVPLFTLDLLRYGFDSMCEQGELAYQAVFMQGRNFPDQVKAFFVEAASIYSENLLPQFSTVCRYPKRFCYSEYLPDDSLNEFHSLQKELTFPMIFEASQPVRDCVVKFSRTTEYIGTEGKSILARYVYSPNYIKPNMRFRNSYIRDLLKAECLEFTIESGLYTLPQKVFQIMMHEPLPVPTGACADAKTLQQKLKKLAPINEAMARISSSSGDRYNLWKSFLNGLELDKRACVLQRVPKNRNSSRLIAEYPVVAQSIGMVIQRCMMAILAKPWRGLEIVQTNQRESAMLALEGSVNGNYATLDASHASDLISFKEVYDMLPESGDIRWLLTAVIPRYYISKYGMKRMSTYAAAGYANTFNMECMYYMLCDSCAITLCNINPEKHDIIARIVGDDNIVRSDIAETVVDVFTTLGNVINSSKSFLDGPYREACGGEYYMGIDVTPVYFPRKQWVLTDDDKLSESDFTSERPDSRVSTFTSAMSLARRLWAYPEAQAIVADFIISHSDTYFTISNDQKETGLRCPLRLRTSYYSDHYYLSNTKQYVRDEYYSREQGKVIKVEQQERRFVAPVPKQAVVDSYNSNRNKLNEEQIKNYYLFEEYLYSQYLAYGPDDSDPILRELGVTLQRKL